MQRPGGTVDLLLECECGKVIKVGEVTTPDGVLTGAHIRQTMYNTPDMTVHGRNVVCCFCREREARQLDLRRG